MHISVCRSLAAVFMLGAVAGPVRAQTAAPAVRPGIPAWNGAPFSGLPSTTAEPGTMQATFRGRLSANAAILGSSGDVSATGKNSNYYLGEYVRLYPGFEGTTANGLRYGAYLEVRQNAGSVSAGGNTGTATLYFRRETAYVGGNWGAVRVGATDGALSLFQTGTFENFADNWNNDFPFLVNSATVPIWPFPNASGNYGNSKVVYVSPSFGGFDFGASFEPSSSGSGEPGCAAAGAGCARLASIGAGAGSFTSNLSTLQRNKDTLELAGRYRSNFGPIGVTAMVGMAIAGNVRNGGLTGLTANGSPQYRFKDVRAVNTGITFNYGGFAVGGDLWTGAINPGGARNTAPVKEGSGDALAFLLGGSYAFGPYIIGASYYNVDRAGAYAQDLAGASNTSVGRMREVGVAVGGTYAWAPGAALSLTYLYGERHQRGVNLYSSTAGTTGNNTRSGGLVLSNYFLW